MIERHRTVIHHHQLSDHLLIDLINPCLLFPQSAPGCRNRRRAAAAAAAAADGTIHRKLEILLGVRAVARIRLTIHSVVVEIRSLREIELIEIKHSIIRISDTKSKISSLFFKSHLLLDVGVPEILDLIVCLP